MKYFSYIILSLIYLSSFSQSNSYNWYPAGESNENSGDFQTLYNDGYGNLYVGGDFDKIAGESINSLAMWDGKKWHDFGFPLADYINDIVKLGDTLIVSGDFLFPQLGMEDIAMYFDGAWHPMGINVNGNGITDGSIAALEVINNDLYAAGSFEHIYQSNGDEINAYFVAKWSNGQWQSLGDGGLDDNVNVMQVHEEKLYIAGEFYGTYNGTTELNYVAIYDPVSKNWSSLEDNSTGLAGVDNYVESIFVNDTAIFIGGWFDEAGGKSAPFLARYTNGVWHSNHGWVIDDAINTISIYKDQLYVGGSFQFNDPAGEEVNDIAVLVDTNWYDLGQGLDYMSGGSLNDLATYDSSLYIVGYFEGGGGVSSENIIRVVKRDTSSSTGISVCDCFSGFSINPNPATNFVNVELSFDKPAQVQISVFNTLGQSIHQFPKRRIPAGKNNIALTLPSLPTGTYFLGVRMKNERIIRPLTISGQ